MKKIAWALMLIGFLLFLYFMPKSLVYSNAFKQGWIPFPFVFVILPIVVFKSITVIAKEQAYAYFFAPLSVLIVGITFGIWHTKKGEKELKEYGVNSIGIVNELKYKEGKSRNYWKVYGYYMVDGKKNKAFFRENISVWYDEPPYEIGEKFDLIYSSRYPNKYDVVTKYDKKYNKKVE